MKYLSVCSGIEAASVAWHHLGWQPVGFSEIEPFPSAVLAHHFPTVPNYGDMTKHEQWPIKPGTVDLLVGGTPCQSFSVAGLRKGLADPRGNLMLTYLAIAARLKPRWIVWENVPGVLSSNGGRDFGSFLGALGQLGYGWAYRVLDAHPVAQKARRGMPGWPAIQGTRKQHGLQLHGVDRGTHCRLRSGERKRMKPHNRWATPTLADVSWPLDEIPSYADREMVLASLKMKRENEDGAPAVAAIACDPIDIFVKDEPKQSHWLGRVLLVTVGESQDANRILGVMVTSVAMREDGDQPDTVRTELLLQVCSFVSETIKAGGFTDEDD